MTSLLFCTLAAAGSGQLPTETFTVIAASDSQQAAYHQQARAAVNEILDRREFGGSGGESLLDRALGFIAQLLHSIGQAFAALPRWLFWLLFVWLVLALLAILAHLLYTVIGLFGARASHGASTGDIRGHGELLGVVDLDFDAAYQRACALLAAGNWAAATRHFYVAAILGLDRTGLIHFRQSKTNHDYVRELRPYPSEHEAFGRLTREFELAIYGRQAPDAALCRGVAELVDSLPHDEHPAG